MKNGLFLKVKIVKRNFYKHLYLHLALVVVVVVVVFSSCFVSDYEKIFKNVVLGNLYNEVLIIH